MNRDEMTELLDKRLSRFEERMEKQFTKFTGQIIKYVDERIEGQFTKLTGQLIQHVDERIDTRIGELEGRINDRFDRLETMMDAIAERVATDDQERAALSHQVNRHETWINQLAEHTQTTLAPEQ